jgi:hypothetical protein
MLGGKRDYVSPRLEAFGRVIDLTQSASCSIRADSETVQVCVPGAMAMQAMSDARTKHKLCRIGDHPLGFGLFLFDYKPGFCPSSHGRQFGVLAQEVEKVIPDAVSVNSEGLKFVDYAMLGITRYSH